MNNSNGDSTFPVEVEIGIIHGILNASWKICSLVVNGQSFLVIDGYLQNLFWN
jgi:hypothetical protein